MYIAYQVVLLIVYIAVFIDCQGGGGGGVAFIGGGSFRGGNNCTTDDCKRHNKIVLGCLFGGLVGFLLLLLGLHCCYLHRQGRPRQDNSIFINLVNQNINQQEAYKVNHFQSGIWSSRYFQYGRWHGPHHFSLSFNSQSMQVTGSGSDDVGVFTIDGIYSFETNRIGMTKTYQLGTGDRSENLGHQVTIQLAWNARNRQFEGKWYVKTCQYGGQDVFELKFDRQQNFSLSENV
ncbi:unnamed protein product [Rotaria sp. Silwood2]|nr:unnamed protein product [Rotaria sp. Silwood2]